jgi:hypothetical protein
MLPTVVPSLTVCVAARVSVVRRVRELDSCAQALLVKTNFPPPRT